MSGRPEPVTRNTPRVVLRKAREGRFGDEPVLVLEVGLAGAKFEHGTRLDIGTRATFVCGPLIVTGNVRHSRNYRGASSRRGRHPMSWRPPAMPPAHASKSCAHCATSRKPQPPRSRNSTPPSAS